MPLQLVVADVAAVVGTGGGFVEGPRFGGAEESCASAADSCPAAPTASPVSQVANLRNQKVILRIIHFQIADFLH